MDTILREELQQLLQDPDQAARVVMVLGSRRFSQAHIPGSETFDDVQDALEGLDPADDIVVYCSGEHCVASAWAQRILTSRGYHRVRRYSGGLADWHAAGLPLGSGAPGSIDVEVAA